MKYNPILTYLYIGAWYLILKFFDGITVVSEEVKKFLYSLNLSKKICVIPNGCYVKKSIRKVEANKDTLSILFYGSLKFKPNVDALRNLVKIIKSIKNRSFSLVVIGEGKLSEYKYAKNINFLGVVKNLDPYIDEADLIVLPYNIKGGWCRIKVLEALGHGKPVIASKLAVRGIPELYYTKEKIKYTYVYEELSKLIVFLENVDINTL